MAFFLFPRGSFLSKSEIEGEDSFFTYMTIPGLLSTSVGRQVFVGILLLLVGWLDYITGNKLGFFVFYFFPLGYVGWFEGKRAAWIYSCVAVALWLLADIPGRALSPSALIEIWNGGIRLLAFLIMSLIFAHLRVKFEKEQQLNLKLSNALQEIKKLSGLLPICASCKKIRDDTGYWEQVEDYIRDHSEARFTHSICPDCRDRLYSEFFTRTE